MTRPALFAAAGLLLVLTVVPLTGAEPGSPAPAGAGRWLAGPSGPVGGDVLVKFKQGVGSSARRKSHTRAGAVEGRRLRRAGWEVAVLPHGADPARTVAAYRLDPRVEAAEFVLDRRITAIPKDLLFQQWALHNIGQTYTPGRTGTPDADIDAPEAWDLVTGSKEIVVAVLDTGIDSSRSDLSKRLVGGYDFVFGDSHPEDDQGHGTAVASIIGAMGNNSNGMTGINWKVSLMPVKICDSGGFCPEMAIANGIDFAVARGADVINMSLACDEHYDNSNGCNASHPGGCKSMLEEESITDALAAGVIVVSAAGNCGRNVDDSTSAYPCAYTAEGNLCVGATDKDDDAVYFSNTGPQNVDIAAPGEDIFAYRRTPPGGATFVDGTSFSTPMVVGVSALLLSRTTLTPEGLRERLMEGTDPGQNLTSVFESGRLNAYNAVADLFLTGRVYATHAPGDVTLLADVTGDGRVDLVRGIDGVGFEIAKNNKKKRKFAGMRLRSTTPPAPFVGAGDFNGDGLDDLVLGDPSAGFHVIPAKNKKGALSPTETWSAENLGSWALAGDVDGDGLTDVVNFGGTFDAMLSTGSSFDASQTWSSVSPGTFTTLADADGDGADDLVLWTNAAGTTEISVALAGSAAFGTPTVWISSDELDFGAAGDFDGDGDSDLAGVDPSDGCVSVFVSDGAAYEDPKIWTCPGIASHVFAGRAGKDGNSRVDLVTRQSATGRWLVLESAH